MDADIDIDANVVVNSTSASSCSQYLGRREVARQGWSGVSSQIAHACLVIDNDSDDDLLLLLHLRHRRKKANQNTEDVCGYVQYFSKGANKVIFTSYYKNCAVTTRKAISVFLRMSKETCDCLVEKVTPSLTTRSYRSGARAEISPAERYPRSL